MRVGIDLIDANDVDRAIDTHGDRYLRRIYTERELSETAAVPGRLAARLAAKEAAMKVLRAADEPVPWREIELCDGADELQLSGRAAALADARRLTSLAVSVTRAGDCACAVVVAGIGR